MTRWMMFLLTLVLITWAPCLRSGELEGADGLVLYVSAAGNDAWTGRSPKPNEAGTDGPFATLEQARDRIRQLKNSNGLPVGGVTVAVMPGRYERSEAFSLTAEDAGSAASPIVYRAWPGGDVTICGSRTVTAWQPVTDPDVLDRLDVSARGKVYQTDLGSLGVETYGDLLHDAAWEMQWRHHRDDNQGEATQGDALAAQRHVQRTSTPVEPRLELFFDGQPMPLSRWPNKGFTHIDKALGETAFDVRGLPGRREGAFSCVDDRVGRWVNEKDALVRGYWFRDWVVQTQRIESIDPENRIIRLAEPYHNKIGLYHDEYRASWPVAHKVDPLPEPAQRRDR